MRRYRAVLAIIAAAALSPAAADAKTCAKKTTGTCTDANTGQAVKIADRARTLRLKSVAVKIIAPHAVTRTLGPFSPDFPNEVATASGRYVTFAVRVTNRGNQPVDTILDLEFDLRLGRALYDDSFKAENLIGAPSLINAGENNTIQPGLSAAGYITFDVARKRTALVRTSGNLLVDDESDKRIGIIRTYGGSSGDSVS